MSTKQTSFVQQCWQDIQTINFTNFCILVITIHYTLLFLLNHIKYSSFKLPPSPPLRLPIVGHLYKLLTKRPHLSLRLLSEKHGNLLLLQLGSVPAVLVSSAELAGEVTCRGSVGFGNRGLSSAGEVFSYSGSGIGIGECEVSGCLWEDEVGRLVERVRGAVGCGVELGGVVRGFSRNVVARSVVGGRCDEFGELERRVSELSGVFCFKDYFPGLDWVDDVRKLSGQLRKAFEDVDGFLDQVVEDHYVELVDSREGSDRVDDFTDALLRLHKEGKLDVELSQDNLKAILWDMLSMGTDAIAVTTEWAIAELMRNPSLMRKVQDEVRRAVGKKQKIDENDVTNMEYLACVIKETLRLHPPSFLVSRETSQRVKLGGYDIPSKTKILINVWAIQRDPNLWDKAEEFLPERFMNRSIDFKGNELGYLPFGGGGRGCPGISYALAVVGLVLANLLYWFDWKLPEGTVPEDLDVSDVYGQTDFKKLPLNLVAVPHIVLI